MVSTQQTDGELYYLFTSIIFEAISVSRSNFIDVEHMKSTLMPTNAQYFKLIIAYPLQFCLDLSLLL